MKLGIPKEVLADERRVAVTPTTLKRFKKQGFDVLIEPGAGQNAGYNDAEYLADGGVLLEKADLFAQADVILKVAPPTADELSLYRPGQVHISYMYPTDHQDVLAQLAGMNISCIAMDCIPRISRAQKMDVLSSMANIAGYRAVIEGANHFGRFLNGQITAAGKVNPARVLVIGAGVAGLAAIGTAKNLGAIVYAFDTRKDVQEQIESMGAEFLTVDIDEDGATSSGYSKVMSQAFIDAEFALFRAKAPEVDLVITTALIPGRPAPKLWLADMVEKMKPGSVVIDLAYSRGGNCELTVPGQVTTSPNGVTILGVLDQMPAQASQLYSNNIAHLLDDMGKADGFRINLEDDVIKGALITHDGKLNWPLPQIAVSTPAPGTAKPTIDHKKGAHGHDKASSGVSTRSTLISVVGLVVLLGLIGSFAPKEFMAHFTIFVLAIFIGWQVVWNVAHALHTPLMSVTNAISGIILLGGMLQITGEFNWINVLAIVAVLVSSINIVGGFMVTHRMLKMFQKRS